jgi:hypothetical protein
MKHITELDPQAARRFLEDNRIPPVCWGARCDSRATSVYRLPHGSVGVYCDTDVAKIAFRIERREG